MERVCGVGAQNAGRYTEGLAMGLRFTTALLVIGSLVRAQNQGADSPGQQANPAAAVPSAPPFVTCPAGIPIGTVDLQVKASDYQLPFRTINRLSEGDTLLYAPVLRGKEKRRGEVALVIVPQKREVGQLDIIVTDPESADESHEWKITLTIAV